MDSSKTDVEKNDSKSKKILGASSSTKLAFSMKTRNIDRLQSKIPKRDACNLSSLPKQMSLPIGTPKTTKPKTSGSLRKPSQSMSSLKILKSNSLASHKNNLNSHRSVKSRNQTPRISEKTSEIDRKAGRAAVNRNLNSFETAREKLQTCQENFMKTYELVKNELPKEEGEYKVVCLYKDNKGLLVAKGQQSEIKIACDQKTLEEFKTHFKNIAENNLKSIEIVDQIKRSPRGIGDTLVFKDQDIYKQIEGAKKELNIEKQKLFDSLLKEIEKLQACEKIKEKQSNTSNKDLEIKIKNYLDEVNKLKKALEDSKTELTLSKNTFENKFNSYKKELEEMTKRQRKKQQEFDELKRKYESLEKENSKEKSINRDVTKTNFEWEELNKNFKKCASKNVNLEGRNDELEAAIQKVEKDLTAALKRNEALIVENSKNSDQVLKHAEEVKRLSSELSNAKKQKENFENEIQNSKNKIIELQKIKPQLVEIQAEVQRKSKENDILNQTIKNLENKVAVFEEHVCLSSDHEKELIQLRNSNSLSSEKIKSLENELIKAQFHIKKLEDKIALDERLLKVRTGLITTLQKKEQSQKVRLEDLFVEVGEKNHDLQMIKTEILTKTEEFQNLFSTLGTKQIEITRQEHMIKLLQESNDRAQKLRVRQEAKIAKLEEEILNLKHVISIYQDVVVPNNALRRNLDMVEARSCDPECTDSLGFYVEERRKKRHIDISVKKYEK